MADRVYKIMKIATDQKVEIEILPWARAYNETLNKKNILIFPLAKTVEREKLFKFSGVIINIKEYIWKLKKSENIKIKNFEESKNYSYCTVRENITEKFLKSKDVKRIEVTSNFSLVLNMLINQRCDLAMFTKPSLSTQIDLLKSKNEIPSTFTISDLEPVSEVPEIDMKR